MKRDGSKVALAWLVGVVSTVATVPAWAACALPVGSLHWSWPQDGDVEVPPSRYVQLIAAGQVIEVRLQGQVLQARPEGWVANLQPSTDYVLEVDLNDGPDWVSGSPVTTATVSFSTGTGPLPLLPDSPLEAGTLYNAPYYFGANDGTLSAACYADLLARDCMDTGPGRIFVLDDYQLPAGGWPRAALRFETEFTRGTPSASARRIVPAGDCDPVVAMSSVVQPDQHGGACVRARVLAPDGTASPWSAPACDWVTTDAPIEEADVGLDVPDLAVDPSDVAADGSTTPDAATAPERTSDGCNVQVGAVPTAWWVVLGLGLAVRGRRGNGQPRTRR